MAFDFPPSPALNEIYADESSGCSFQWNGAIWEIVATPERPRDFGKITGGVISSPVNYFDVALSGGYSKYILDLYGADPSSGALYPTLVFSFDGGLTWLQDVVNNDTYSVNDYKSARLELLTGEVLAAEMSLTMTIDVFPGTDSAYPSCVTAGNGMNTWTNASLASGGSVNKLATIPPPSPSRSTHMRIYANWQGAPTIDFISGSWTLYGVN